MANYKKCDKCGYERRQKPNSTLYYPCLRCKAVDKMVKSKSYVKKNKFDFYKTTAWKWCKMYVLLYYCDNKGFVHCSTSPNLVYHVTDRYIHVGHWIKYRDGNSTHNSTALIFYNLAPQSSRDNVRFNGKPDEMEKFLREKHGDEKIDELLLLKNQPLKLDPVTLEEIAFEYRTKFYELLKIRGIENPFK